MLMISMLRDAVADTASRPESSSRMQKRRTKKRSTDGGTGIEMIRLDDWSKVVTGDCLHVLLQYLIRRLVRGCVVYIKVRSETALSSPS